MRCCHRYLVIEENVRRKIGAADTDPVLAAELHLGLRAYAMSKRIKSTLPIARVAVASDQWTSKLTTARPPGNVVRLQALLKRIATLRGERETVSTRMKGPQRGSNQL